MKQAKETTDIRELKKELQQLSQFVQDNVKEHVGNGVGNVIGFDATDIRRMAKKAGKGVRSYFSEKADQAEELRHQAEETISARPFTSVAIALAGGLLLGALLKRR